MINMISHSKSMIGQTVVIDGGQHCHKQVIGLPLTSMRQKPDIGSSQQTANET